MMLFDLFFNVFGSVISLFNTSELLLVIMLVCVILSLFEIILHILYFALRGVNI